MSDPERSDDAEYGNTQAEGGRALVRDPKRSDVTRVVILRLYFADDEHTTPPHRRRPQPDRHEVDEVRFGESVTCRYMTLHDVT